MDRLQAKLEWLTKRHKDAHSVVLIDAIMGCNTKIIELPTVVDMWVANL
jgi:hypothetical protein